MRASRPFLFSFPFSAQTDLKALVSNALSWCHCCTTSPWRTVNGKHTWTTCLCVVPPDTWWDIVSVVKRHGGWLIRRRWWEIVKPRQSLRHLPMLQPGILTVFSASAGVCSLAGTGSYFMAPESCLLHSGAKLSHLYIIVHDTHVRTLMKLMSSQWWLAMTSHGWLKCNFRRSSTSCAIFLAGLQAVRVALESTLLLTLALVWRQQRRALIVPPDAEFRASSQTGRFEPSLLFLNRFPHK